MSCSRALALRAETPPGNCRQSLLMSDREGVRLIAEISKAEQKKGKSLKPDARRTHWSSAKAQTVPNE
jgi:hypothetical protein